MLRRKYSSFQAEQEFKPESTMDCLMSSYFDILPPLEHQTNIVCWEQSTLNELDSTHLKQSYMGANQYYRSLFTNLMEGEGSPYLGKGSLAYEEFLWAFNNVSSRHTVLHDHAMDQDPNLILCQLPVIDLLNHSLTPNVGVFPYHDKIDDKSFLVVKALRDIEPDEELTMSYGNLSNIHLVQKYGFTLGAQAQDERNTLQANYPYGEYQQVVYEELRLKEQLSSERLLPFDAELFQGTSLYPNRFEQSVLQRLRLAFLTSRTIMDYGGTAKLTEEVDFKSYFDEFNESCALQFLIDSVEMDLKGNLKPREVYE